MSNSSGHLGASDAKLKGILVYRNFLLQIVSTSINAFTQANVYRMIPNIKHKKRHNVTIQYV